MQLDISQIQRLVQTALEGVSPAIQLEVCWRGEIIISQTQGRIPGDADPIQPDTLFDLASITKLYVVTALMRLVEAKQISLDQPVSRLLPEAVGWRPVAAYEDPLHPGQLISLSPDPSPPIDASQITFRQLITHTSGLPAWRPLFQQPDPYSARHMALQTFFSVEPETRILYSDIGLIWLGLALERLTQLSLDQVVRQQLTDPLGLIHTRYLPMESSHPVIEPIAPTEFCVWRQRRIRGEVHDENAARLGGLAGHAGLFSTAAEVARFGQVFLAGGDGLLSPATVAMMTQTQAQDGNTRRGLGFALWSADPEASSNPFSQAAFGHTGFTGTSVWMDPERDLVVVCLTNSLYHGRQADGILSFRVRLHRAIVEAIDQAT